MLDMWSMITHPVSIDNVSGQCLTPAPWAHSSPIAVCADIEQSLLWFLAVCDGYFVHDIRVSHDVSRTNSGPRAETRPLLMMASSGWAEGVESRPGRLGRVEIMK